MIDIMKSTILGQKSEYKSTYDKSLLHPIARKIQRCKIGIQSGISLPFKGYDVWNAYELSWLSPQGKPKVAIAQIIYDCKSDYLVESKSLKLYLNSFNNTVFESVEAVKKTISTDLQEVLKIKIMVNILDLNFKTEIAYPTGYCIDDEDISINWSTEDKAIKNNVLEAENETVTETLYSNLLKSNCLVTNQPDWGTVIVTYRGNKIVRSKLLEYIISFRNHNEFHEQCVERIFRDIMQHCAPEQLTVYARYTRRGGIDINPIRSTQNISTPVNTRFIRQ